MGNIYSNMRRVAGVLLILFAVIPFLYAAVNLCFLFSEYDFRFGLVDISSFEPFTIFYAFTHMDWSFTSLSIVLCCLQLVLPAFLLGGQMVKRSWSPMSYWALGIMVIVALFGLWGIIECALYQYNLIQEINSAAKEEVIMPAIYGCGLFGLFFDVCSIFMCIQLNFGHQERHDGMSEGRRAILIHAGCLVFLIALVVNSFYWIGRIPL